MSRELFKAGRGTYQVWPKIHCAVHKCPIPTTESGWLLHTPPAHAHGPGNLWGWPLVIRMWLM